MPLKPCTVAGCPNLSTGGKCEKHLSQFRKIRDSERGSSKIRGYTGVEYKANRITVLRRDPICVMCGRNKSKVADHHPKTRRELLAMGVKNPDHHSYMRGLCVSCHSSWTATTTPNPGFRRKGT